MTFPAIGISGLGLLGSGRAADFLSRLPPAEQAPSAGKPDLSLETERRRLDEYLAARDAAAKAEYGDTPPSMVAVAMPVSASGATPFVSMDQQILIDQITKKYAGRSDYTRMYDELRQNGVHPDQISAGARWFIREGMVTDREGHPLQGVLLDRRV